MKIEIDGSDGEGGGQIIRTSLALSIISGKPFKIDHIRAKRQKPGLLRQHLTAVNAATQISSAEITGNELNSSTIEFAPNKTQPGNYDFQIGTAGSVTLVAQTILPALMICEEKSLLTISGGTHNNASPPFDFFDLCFLRLLRKLGFRCQARIQTHGFYPAGGGTIELEIEPPSDLTGLELLEKIKKWKPTVRSLVAKLPLSIAERENSTIQKKTNWNPDHFQAVEIHDSPGPGNVVMIRLDSADHAEMLTGFGEVNRPAEQVARSVLREARKLMSASVPVGPYLTDQLLLPMSIAASRGHSSSFLTTPLSQHSKSQIEVIQLFLDVEISMKDTAEGNVVVSISHV